MKGFNEMKIYWKGKEVFDKLQNSGQFDFIVVKGKCMYIHMDEENLEKYALQLLK